MTLCFGIDIGLNIYQTNTYHQFSQNKSNQVKSLNKTDESVTAPSYLYAAVGTWIFTPVVWSIFLVLYTGAPFSMVNRFLKLYLDHETKYSAGKMGNIVIGLLVLPVDIIASALWLYIIVPYYSIKRSLQTAILGQKFDKEDDISFDLPVVGVRALPQLILTVVFIINEYQEIWKIDTGYFQIPCPISFISVGFSAVSLLVGFITASIKVCYKQRTLQSSQPFPFKRR